MLVDAPEWLGLWAEVHTKKDPLHGRDSGGTAFREMLVNSRGRTTKKAGIKLRDSLLCLGLRGYLAVGVVAAVQIAERLSLARSTTGVGKHRRDVYFARRSTVAHRSGRHHGTVEVEFHEVFQRPGLPRRRRHMGQRQGAVLADETEIRGACCS